MGHNWNQVIANLPLAHFLQTEQWAQVKQRIGWQPYYAFWNQVGQLSLSPGGISIPGEVTAAALILERKITLLGIKTGLSMLYIPKGPLFDGGVGTGKAILEQLIEFGQKRRAIFLKIDPDVILGTGIEGQGGAQSVQGESFKYLLQSSGWKFSPDQIQFRNTIQVNLAPVPETLLSLMKSKTRYNIRLAERKGVTVRQGTIHDLPVVFSMYAATALRDNFILREKDYYLHAWQLFMENQLAEPLIAEVEGDPVAAMIVFRFAGKAWYVYGMSSDLHREKMPNHLLQWQAMLRAKEAGCTVYDFWGAPGNFVESDPLWGVYRFKEGFGGQVIRTIGAWDYALKPRLYHTMTILLPKILDYLRRKARRQLRSFAQT